MPKSLVWKLRKGTAGSPFKYAALCKEQSRHLFFDSGEQLYGFLIVKQKISEAEYQRVMSELESEATGFKSELTVPG
jgi:hypothetical protein